MTLVVFLEAELLNYYWVSVSVSCSFRLFQVPGFSSAKCTLSENHLICTTMNIYFSLVLLSKPSPNPAAKPQPGWDKVAITIVDYCGQTICLSATWGFAVKHNSIHKYKKFALPMKKYLARTKSFLEN